ncbi:unnamed protein product [Penicillium salamii]|uniref:Uncharacterized protein n=1 Tax=Penicillium salamii TaxID=1612424 RepID=A0A9W4IH38_9EURO|nr:unnamed protein product [Penicillium salamii]CAG7952612.1 unnamed protein product [Penicillium salamii]CAG8105251.1 unnamed protein product [Penicillium salamii]CAG8116873.1 unnamed protein product [Penicillium salamii]CAG8302699.1 unnamed protein product [Penicillium salamii]
MEKHAHPAQFPPVQSLSPRIPSMSPHFNEADRIEKYLHEDGHRAWGFVIYRCTYESDTAWEEFMRRLLANTEETLEGSGGLDLLDNLAVTVFQDSSFDGATAAVVRDHFKRWAATAAQQEQGTGPGFSERYLYCIQVTQDVLDSVLADDDGFVRLVRGDWKEYDPHEEAERVEEEHEALEGCTLENVGWMQVPFDGVMVIPWYYLRGYGWEREYRRPPTVACF